MRGSPTAICSRCRSERTRSRNHEADATHADADMATDAKGKNLILRHDAPAGSEPATSGFALAGPLPRVSLRSAPKIRRTRFTRFLPGDGGVQPQVADAPGLALGAPPGRHGLPPGAGPGHL